MTTNRDESEALVRAEVSRLIAAGFDTGGMSGDGRHRFVVGFFPGGMSGVQFAAATIMSADAEGVVDPPSVEDFFKRHSLILRLSLDGLIARRCKMHERGPYYLTSKARAMRGDA